ncbi:MAG TPA: polysaccharide deacetylase family protein [Polyangiaceae bacterium]
MIGLLARQGGKALLRAIVPPDFIAWSGPKPRGTPRGRVALTFDDGPTELTRGYLSVLARYDVKATFFVVGELCARYPELVDAIARAGHELAGHGYTHRRFTELTRAELRGELERTQALLPKCGRRRPFVRPPHGALSLRSSLECARAGFRLVLWSRDSGDWREKRASDVARAFDTPPGAGDIVLCHDGQAWTLQALPAILENSRKAGHELCTVGELLGA